MLRRSHKKSKNGCLECRKRHVKCDEQHPICRLCQMSNRDCSFTLLPPSSEGAPLSKASPSTQGSLSIQGNGDRIDPIDEATGSNHISPARSTASAGTSDYCGTDPAITDPINIHHMELLSHVTSSPDLFNLGDRLDSDPNSLSYSIELALAFPYLLHQLLAFSARHLAFLRPSRHQHYNLLAVSLQSRAISLFNDAESSRGIDKSNCVPILLFSVVLGHHLLADLLEQSARGQGDLNSFLRRFVQCVKTNRGIFNVCCSAWPLLIDSKLQPILTISASFTSQDPAGDDCDRVFSLLDASPELTQREKEACCEATRYLQIGFDALRFEHGVYCHNRYSMIFSWTMLISPAYATMLEEKKPQALVVLAHYMLLLHGGRSMWQIGDSGQYLLNLLGDDHLCSEWAHWIPHPQGKP